ncbi:MAG: hypothetical protein RhofKO_16580 [Rhodothermales bacterium]
MRSAHTRLRTLIFSTAFLLITQPGQAQPMAPTDEAWSPAQQEVWQTVEAYSAASQARDLERYLSHWHPQFLGWHSGDDAPTTKADRAEGLTWYFSQTPRKIMC